MANKKLYKDKNNSMISGVCAGIAKYFDIDPTIVRLIWACAILFAGTGILAYIICAIIIPDEPDDYTEVDYTEVK
ncbi:MAG: PspC domain-containing protein [Eubacterium sp.]|nr:PspC domain-containing protein [Eubacterium sp.]